jgi:hypothetical protein
MSGIFGVTVVGLDTLVRRLGDADRIVGDELVTMVNQATALGSAKSRSIAPVDTGALRSGITARPAVRAGRGATGSFAPNVPYAIFVELGHRTRGGKSFVQGRFFMRGGRDAVIAALPRLGAAAQQRIVARIGL